MNLQSEGCKDLTPFFHTSLKSSVDYTAYSFYHMYALLQASFLFSSSRLPPFRDLKITARHMTPLSSLSRS